MLVTDPHPGEATYKVSLTDLRGPGQTGLGASASREYDLSGVEAVWREGEGEEPTWSGWWPHVDPEEVRKRAAGSVRQERALELLARPGRLGLRTLVTLPEGKHVLRVASSGTIEEAVLNFEEGLIGDDGRHAEFTLESRGEPAELALTVRTGEGGKPLTLRVTDVPGDDTAERTLSADQVMVPWAPTPPPGPLAPATPPPILTGGDAKRGEAVFRSEEARCSACHKFRGEGGVIGPDLSDQSRRERAAIFRDIAEPSARINPGYVPYTVVLKDGRVLSGVVRTEDAETVRVLDTNAQETRVKRSEIEELRPSATSIMPVGLTGALGDLKIQDLMAYLTSGAE